MAWLDDPFEEDVDDLELSSSVGFGVVVRLWSLLGAVDENECLTELGWWRLPKALDRAWRPRDDGG